MTRHYNDLLDKDATNAGMDPPGGEPVLDREAWMRAARERRRGLIDYWRERGRADLAEKLR